MKALKITFRKMDESGARFQACSSDGTRTTVVGRVEHYHGGHWYLYPTKGDTYICHRKLRKDLVAEITRRLMLHSGDLLCQSELLKNAEDRVTYLENQLRLARELGHAAKEGYHLGRNARWPEMICEVADGTPASCDPTMETYHCM